jgi:class 3 adenylate cyclase
VAVEPVHRTILAVDIEAFSDPARTNPIRLRLHQHLTRLLTDLLTQAGVTDDQYATSDTGDGLVISVAPHTSAVRLLDPLVPRLARRLAAFNRGKPPPNRMRLRVAVHAGGVLADPQPLHGDAVIHTCRLLDSPVARSCLQATQQPLVVIVSRTVYDEVVRHGYGRIVPAAWQPVTAQIKETAEPAWIHVPGDPGAPIRAKLVTPPVSPDPRTGPAPRELPGRLTEFTGRHQELARLHEFLGAVATGTPAVVITAIDGLGGVGKSSLAVEAAWRLADRFPDGQLYLDLHGSTVGLDPLTPLQALTHLLGSLGTDPSSIPTEVEEATARYRTLASHRRLLILLDNARDATQVRPLLPGHPGCAVLVTSRDTLAFLDGVTRVALDVLPEPQALELLDRLVGPDRIHAEPDAARRLVRACGLLPLAIQLTGRRLATRPAWSLAHYAALLADEHQRLGRLRFGDRAVGSSFQLSYQLLDDHHPQTTRALRLLSLLDGPDVTIPVAAALLDQPASQVEAILGGP